MSDMQFDEPVLGSDIRLPKQLRLYESADFLLKNHVKLLFSILKLLVGFIVVLLIMVAFQLRAIPVYISIIGILLAMGAVIFTSIHLLFRGHYIYSSNTLVIGLFVLLWVLVFFDQHVTLEQISNFAYLFVFMFLLPLITHKKNTIIAVFSLNIILLVVFLIVKFDYIVLLGGNVYSSIRDWIVGFLLSGVLMYITSELYHRTILKQHHYIKRMEQIKKRLINNEKKYQDFIENFPEAYYRFSVNGHVTYLNTAARGLIGIDKDYDISTINMWSTMTEADCARMLNNIMHTSQGNFNQGAEYQMNFWGRIVTVKIFATRILKNGKVIGTEGIALNITHTKRMEEELKRSEELMRIVIDDSPNVLLLTDTSGTIVITNNAFARYVGVTQAQAVGKSIADFELAAGFARDGVIEELLRTGKEISSNIEYSNSHGRKDYFQCMCKLLEFREQKFVYISMSDISEQKKVEIEVSRRQSMVMGLLEAMPNIVLLVREDSIVEWCNEEFLKFCGYGREEIIGKSINDFFLKNSPVTKGHMPRTLNAQGYAKNNELFAVNNKGDAFNVLISTVSVWYNDQHMYLSIVIDVTEKARIDKELEDYRKNLEIMVEERTNALASTNEELSTTIEDMSVINKEYEKKNEELVKALHELKKVQSQLVQAEKMTSLGVLTSGIAHEINNPLNYIRGGILGIDEFILNNCSEKYQEVSPLIFAVNEGVERASAIVRGVSRYSHHSERNDEKCDIHLILESCLVILHAQMSSIITIEKFFTEQSYMVRGNEGKLHQVFVNIIQNAIQALTANGGKIIIRTEVADDHVVIEIIDNGVGMTEGVLKHIFDPFFTTKEPGKGTGLGLAISYSIVVEHEGEMFYDSKPGFGTKATVKLPLWS